MRPHLFKLVWMISQISLAAALCPGQDVNIARARKYTLSPPPNYSYCTDPKDTVQLTDGIYTSGYFWTQTTTVGWSNAHPVIISIDLGSIQPIAGVSYNTAAGVAGVQWPASIDILVSDDGKTYTYIADLIELATRHGKPKTTGYQVHRFWTKDLKTHARYVSLIIRANGSFTFVDEIEVYRGPDDYLNLPLSGEKVENVKQFFEETEMARAIRRRLRSDLAEVRTMARQIDGGNWQKESATIEKAISRIKKVPPENFRAVLPLNDLHRRIFSLQAAVWRRMGFDNITVWQKNRWDMLSPTEPPRKGGAKIDLAMMKNEFRSAAFNISNAADQPAEIRLSILGLPPGPNPDYISVHEVPFTGTKSGTPVAAALPYAAKENHHYSLTIPAGMTRQVWFTFHPVTIPAGRYSGSVRIEPGGIEVPLKLRIYPLRFPDQPTLHLGGWDYTDREYYYNLTPKNRSALIRHLREHFVDTPWATSRVMPTGRYNKQGDMIEEPTSEYFHQWIQRWPNARNYYVFANVGSTFAGFKMGTPPFRKALANWITWWVEKLRSWNIRPQQLGLLLVDEPHSHDKDKIIIEYARVIQKAQPQVVIWEDPIWRDPRKATPELFEVCDILCPNLPMWIAQGPGFADFYIQQRDAGRILWFYSCSGPGKLLDPYSYHRLQQWFCWKYKVQGSCFWAFGDSNGSSSWNEYLARIGAYTPVFLDEDSVTAGKHMEAIREGIEDFQYLKMLQDAIAELQTRPAAETLVAAAKQLLNTAADRVTSRMTNADMIYWKQPKDRSLADTVRLEVLEMLLQLKQSTQSSK